MKKLITIIVLLMLPISLFAEVPNLISYSGKITDKNGNILPDEIYQMKFSLYDDPSAGSLKWTETHNVNLIAGAYHVFLGQVNTNLPKFDQNYWLEIELEGEKFGRQQIVTVPYAMRSEYSNESESLVTAAMNLIVPIGSIIAWHKNFTNTPALPATFMECNGQVVTDVESPYHGQILPNLNGENRFLRGSAHSGDVQADAFQGHWHYIRGKENYIPANTGGTEFAIWEGGANLSIARRTEGPESDGVNGTPRIANETRPKNMSITWIIRIK